MIGAGAAGSVAPDFTEAALNKPGLHLADGVFIVRIEDEVVCLDVARDAYSVVADPDRSLQFSSDSDDLFVTDPALAQALVQAGLATTARAGRKRAVAPLLPNRSLLAAPAVRPRPSDLRDFACLMIAAPLAHRLGSLSSLVTWSTRRGPAVAQSLTETARRAQVFSGLLALAPVRGDCLFRSHLLLRFLRMGGCDARWVFAVRTWPFAAHCWLQCEDLVLNDAPDGLRAFHAIASF